MSSLKVKRRVFYGWWIVLACSLLTCYGAGIFYYGFSAFVQPMAKDLGWSMALISGAFSLQRLETGVAAPLVGFLLDRFGPRKLVVSGAILMGAGFIYLSQTKTVLPFYVAFFLVSLGWSFNGGTALSAPLIGKWFIKRRGRALGFYSAGVGLSGLLVPVLSYLIALYGWRLTLLIVGPVTWLVSIPLALPLRHKPEEHRLLPDGEVSGHDQGTLVTTNRVSVREVDFPVREAMLSPAFWLLTLCFFAFQMSMSALFVHLVPCLITSGIEAQLAALVVTFITVFSILGRLGFGWLADLLSKKRLLIIIFLLQAIGVFAFTQVRQVLYLIPFLLAYAPSYGGVIAVRSAIIGEYYGRKNFGTVNGLITGIAMLGGIAGPVIAGLAYDINGSYYVAFVSFALLNLFSALLLLLLKRPSLKYEG